MDMHAADHQAARDALEVLVEPAVAFALGMLLVLRPRRRMGRGGDRRHAELAGELGHGPAQFQKLGARRGGVLADPGLDLDLGAQEFRADPRAEPALAALQQFGRQGADQLPGLQIDEQVLLLDPQREARARDHAQNAIR